MTLLQPGDLLDLMTTCSLRPQGLVATDTETSGLYADDGARVSTASVAWEDVDGEWLDFTADAAGEARVNWNFETICEPCGFQANIVSLAWPFDQGTEGKPESNGQPTLWPEAENLEIGQWEALLAWLAGCPDGLVMHNGKFDLEKYRVGVRRWPGRGHDLQDRLKWDTQNVNHLIYPLERTSLKPTAGRLFGQEYEDESKKVHAYLKKAKLPAGRWDLMPWDIIGQYADVDARLTKMLELRQRHDVEVHGAAGWLGGVERVLEMIERRLATTFVLYRMEMRGLPYDEVGSRDAALEARTRAEKVAAELPFDPTGPQAKQFFFGEGKTKRGAECLNMIPYALTDKGEPSMTAEVVARMVEDGVPHADKWAEYAKASTAASMWYEGYADAIGSDGRIRTCFRQNGTVSSRFSVERINLQAIPQDYRLSDHTILDGIPTPRDLIASAVRNGMPGWTIYELDLAQAELRVGAMFAGCKRMLEMIERDEDLHTYTTRALFPNIDPKDPLFKSKWRQVGKRGNFSLQFGSGGDRFARMVSKETGIRLEPHEADRIVRDWNGLYPEYKRAIDKHSNTVARRQAKHGRGWLDLLNKERRWFDRYEETHKAFNQRVQGNLAQFGVDWMLESDAYLRGCQVSEQAREMGIGRAGLILTIHDSQVLLLPDDEEGRKMAATCAEFGKDLWKRTFPDVPGDVDYKAWGV